MNSMHFTENGFCFVFVAVLSAPAGLFPSSNKASVCSGQKLRFARTEAPFRPDRASVSLMNRFGFSRRETFTLWNTAVALSGRTAVDKRIAGGSSPKQEAVCACIGIVSLCIAGQSSLNREPQRMRHRMQCAACPWLPVWQANVFLLRFAK